MAAKQLEGLQAIILAVTQEADTHGIQVKLHRGELPGFDFKYR